MAARKKAEPKAEPVEEVVDVQATETEPVEEKQSTPSESKPERHEDGGLAALQARFDNASRKGYFGPDKEF